MNWLSGGSQYAGAFPGEMLSNLPHVAWRNYQTATPTLRCQYDHGRIYVNYFHNGLMGAAGPELPLKVVYCPFCGRKIEERDNGEEEKDH